jgi:hypothetical protein
MPEQLPPDLERVADLVRRAAPSSEAPPQGLRDETIAAIERQRELDGTASRAARSRPARGRRSLVPRLLPALAAAAAVVLAVVVLGGGDEAPEGELEVRAQLVGDGSRATAEVREIGIGRTITFRSDSLPMPISRTSAVALDPVRQPADPPEGRVLRALVRRPGRPPRSSEPHLGGHLPPRSRGPLGRRLHRCGGPRQVPAAQRHGGARRRRPAPLAP